MVLATVSALSRRCLLRLQAKPLQHKDCNAHKVERWYIVLSFRLIVLYRGDKMVDLWSGTPGSGKSLHLAHDVREKLRWGRKVISTCNIETSMCFMNHLQEFLFNISKGKINLSGYDDREKNFYYIPIEMCTPEIFYEFAARHHVFGKEHQTIIYFDECVAIFSPTVIGDNKELWNRWDTFLRLHRHLGFDIVLIPQSKRLISRKVIEYAEHEVKHYNRKHHGTLGFFAALFLGGLFSYSVCWRGEKKPIEQKFFTYKPYYGQMYNSYAMFDSVLLPYKRDWERRQELYSKISGQLKIIADNRSKEDLT